MVTAVPGNCPGPVPFSDKLLEQHNGRISAMQTIQSYYVAAGALVTEGRRIPARSVVMGVPGKIVREVSAEELERTHTICAHYLEMAQRYARGAYPPPWTR